MVSSKIIGLSALALLHMSFAAPAPAPAPQAISATTAAIDWTPVDFNGKTIYVNSAALAVSSTINPAKKAVRDLAKRAIPDNDNCGASTFKSHSTSYGNVADCAVIRDWAGTLNKWWEIWNNTPDTHGLLYYGTCVFEAGTQDQYGTWIGSTDIRDITRDAINKFQSGGLIAAKGEMRCDSTSTWIWPEVHAAVKWNIKHS